MRAFLFFALLSLLSGAALAERVENFVLLDHRGDAHELYYHKKRNRDRIDESAKPMSGQ